MGVPGYILLFLLLAATSVVTQLTIEQVVGSHILRDRKTESLTNIRNNGAVATENEICSNVGIDILKKKNATVVDAAIAASICLGTINMYSTGLGGGGFMLVSQDGVDRFIDFREAAPKDVNPERYKQDPNLAIKGGYSVAIPGNARGYEMAHLEFGGLPWNQLFAPSIKLASEGWTASKYLESRAKYLFSNIDSDSPSIPAFSEFLSPSGKIITEGSKVKRINYSKTLTKLALYGADYFYKGKVAELIVKTVQDEGGVLSLDDMASYVARKSVPVYSSYKKYKVITTPLPTSGGILAFVLKAMELLNLEGPRTPESIRRIIEVFKYAYAQRSAYGDVTKDTSVLFAKLHDKYLSPQYINNIVKSIMLNKDKTFDPSYYRPIGIIPREHGTTHLSVMDKKGNVALITSTINLPFGSMVINSETGVILNNEIDDFSIEGRSNYFKLEESPYNYIAPNKRSMSSSAPVIILNEDNVPVLALGASGGSHITTAIALVIANYLEFGLGPEESISLPRIHHQLVPNKITHESGVEPSIIEYLKSHGHVVEEENFITGVQMVCINNGMIEGYSDKRKHGKAKNF